ncbi:Cmx/CmrA family chloramphenicol efflux MFS transporter [Nocardia carnea]|uniref:Cmx/CmrA family chloramphenicol efflux MFS transporter n=1 Tax=Nocardia carnea TaxID=37328 RepID=UPI0024541830|nr:Cmx/CmrA family chloramphenicol efflux MFS transporter [Nocardia carnea]
MPFALYLLAMAVFAMGTSEFMLAGLVPDIATDLGVELASTGLLTSAFAIGMAVGAPVMAVLARNRPARSSLLVFVAVFLAAHIAGAVTTEFIVLVATRVIAALANAGFLAVALTAATGLVPADRRGRALAVLLSGTTVATIAGVPGGALLGAVFGWRITFWAVALLCVPAAIGVLTGIPARLRDAENGGPGLAAELAVLARPRLMVVMLLGALVNAATFGAFTFLAPLVTERSGLGDLWVPAALVLFGIGSFAGVTVAGRFSDTRPGAVVAVAGPLLCAGWFTTAVSAERPAVLLVLVLVQGALSFALGSTLITRVLYEAAAAPALGGSYATAALNIGAAVGPVVAACALGTRLGSLGPVVSGGVLVAIALLVASCGRSILRGRPSEPAVRVVATTCDG